MSHFETKEQYLHFISAWKSATNAEEAKSKRVVCDHIQYNWSYPGWTDEERARFEEKGYKVSKRSYTIPNGGHYKDRGWLNAEHYIFYNIMKGRDPKHGFSPKMKRKLQYGETPWTAFEMAAIRLERAITNAEYNLDCISKGQIPPRYKTDSVIEFLKPFGGMIKEHHLLRINKEELAAARKFHR